MKQSRHELWVAALPVLALGAGLAVSAPASAQDKLACAAAAASQYEPGFATVGRDFKDIEPDVAVAACQDAVDKDPGSDENKAWLARALIAAGRIDEAMPLLEAAVAGDSLLARQLLGDALQGEFGCLRTDYARSLDVLRPAAEAGFALAEFSLGYSYDLGIGVDEADAEALKWYERAAKQGLAAAQGNLGYLYQVGSAGPVDYEAAFKWYSAAAAQDDIVGIYGLGQLHEFGQGVPVDYAKAAELFRRGADMGDSYAQNDLGYLYDVGEGVAEDAARAAGYYQLAADQGYGLAQANLGQLYSAGRGVEQDLGKAFELFSRAHEQGEMQGTVGLAQAYLYGEGTAQDYEEARILAQQAADAGYPVAQATLGYIYSEGYGVPRDFQKAIELYDLAAAQDNEYARDRAAEARAELACGTAAATTYEAGFEFTGHAPGDIDASTAVGACEEAVRLDGDSLEDKTWLGRALAAAGRGGEALPLLEEAVAGQWPPGQSQLGDLLQAGIGVDADPARAVDLYRGAAIQGYAPAMYGLAIAYERGLGLPPDAALARKWYQRAAEFSMPAATDAIAALDNAIAVKLEGPGRAQPKS